MEWARGTPWQPLHGLVGLSKGGGRSAASWERGANYHRLGESCLVIVSALVRMSY